MLRSTAQNSLDSVSSVLFPADCRVCGLPLVSLSLLPVCESCWNRLPAQPDLLCARCGESLAFEPGSQTLCRPCRLAPPPFQKAVAWGVYRDELRTLLHLMKYDGLHPLSKRLGVLLAEAILTIPNLPADLLVVPVPLHSAKQRQRGCNQAELLARGAIAVLRQRRPELRVQLAAGLLTRGRATESQASLTPRERRINLRGAFAAARPEALSGRHALLIDDIYTTGATARACARALRQAGAAGVWVATVARAQREIPPAQPIPAPRTHAESPAIPMQEGVAFRDAGSRQQ